MRFNRAPLTDYRGRSSDHNPRPDYCIQPNPYTPINIGGSGVNDCNPSKHVITGKRLKGPFRHISQICPGIDAGSLGKIRD